MKRSSLLLFVFAGTAFAWAATGMRLVQGGSYTPLYRVGEQRQVRVANFLMDPYPVTNADYLEFVKAKPEWRRSRAKKVFAEEQYLAHWSGDLEVSEQQLRSPVVYVSWFAARAYARWCKKRLPTQDEWEFAARADENQIDASRSEAFHRRILDWYGRPTPDVLPPVGAISENVYGLHDMHGLVWEWVSDFNTVLVTGESRQDTGLDRQLFCAGGAVGSTNPADYAAYMRYAYRSSLQARYTVKNLGFRCARNPEGASP